MKHVGRRSRKLALSNYDLELIIKTLITMDVEDIVMKRAIANILSTVQVRMLLANDLFAEDSPLARKL